LSLLDLEEKVLSLLDLEEKVEFDRELGAWSILKINPGPMPQGLLHFAASYP